MQEKFFMKKGFIIGAAVLLCSALGASIYLRTAFDPKPAEGLDYDDPPTRTELLADPALREKWLVEPDSIYDLYLGQTEGGVCTHDESFTEPVIPEGKYYPNGDRNADYYMEIKNGTFCLRWQDGSVASDDRVWGGEREYKVVTFHYADNAILCSEWHEYTDEEREQNGTLDKYSVIHGVSVTFCDGKAYIMPPAFRAGEGNVIRTDPSNQLSIPDET